MAGEEDAQDAERARLASYAASYATRKYQANFWHDEMYQEAWLIAWNAWDTWEDGHGANRRTWMVTKAVYGAMDTLRQIEHTRYAPQERYATDFEAEDKWHNERYVAYDEAEYEHIENRLALAQLMAVLSDKHREVIQRIDLDGMRLIDLADEQGVTEAAISYRRKAAIQAMRKAVGTDARLPMDRLDKQFG